jgi:hypothetical protein
MGMDLSVFISPVRAIRVLFSLPSRQYDADLRGRKKASFYARAADKCRGLRPVNTNVAV